MTSVDLVPVPAGRPVTTSPASEAKVPTSFRGIMLAGGILLGATFGGVGLWAALAPLSSAAVVPGVLVAAGRNQLIQHLEGGIVKEVKVKEGDRVAAGDVLVVLEPTRVEAQVDLLRGQLDAALALQARLQAERDGAAKPTFPEEIRTRANRPDVAAIINGQESQFALRKTAIDGQVTILKQRVAQAREQIRGLTSQKESQERQLELIQDELDGLRELHEKGYAPRTRILALEREASRLMGERGERQGEIARTQQVIGETELQILQVQKNFQEEVANQLREVQNSIFDLRERLRASTDVLDRTVLRAPEDGVIIGLKLHTVGGVVPPGQVLMEVVPDRQDLIIEGQLSVTDVDNVHVGMEADVHFSAFTQATTPVLTGILTNVSADRRVDERSGAAFYTVQITVPEEERLRLGDRKLVSGMPADSFVKTGEKTPLRYLLEPLTRTIERAFREN